MELDVRGARERVCPDPAAQAARDVATVERCRKMMKPYYEDSASGIAIYHGDCREVLPEIDKASIDVILTDPPFFMPATHYSSRTHWQRSWGDTSVLAAFWAASLDGMVPTLKQSGHLLSFCNGDSYPVFYPDVYRRFDVVRSLVWDKGRIGMGAPWRNQHELVIAARWDGYYRGEDKGRPDVLRHSSVPAARRIHPVDKPTALLSELLIPVTPPNGVVLDPFAGGGSTLIAAVQSGHTAIGIESEERYCEIIASRLAQGDLFGGAA